MTELAWGLVVYVAIGAEILGVLWLATWWTRRRRRRHLTLGPRWLNEHAYDNDGDRRGR